MTKIILYHGTTENNARQIKKNGFVPDKKYNWDVHSKKGFVYLSIAYAPFYASMAAKRTNKLALIQCQVNTKDCYPEDDFLMYIAGKRTYIQKEVDTVKLEIYKDLWEDSLEYLGNIATKPNKIKILGIRKFNSKNLLHKYDPCISPMNFKVMGRYYKGLTEWIFAGNEILEYESINQFIPLK